MLRISYVSYIVLLPDYCRIQQINIIFATDNAENLFEDTQIDIIWFRFDTYWILVFSKQSRLTLSDFRSSSSLQGPKYCKWNTKGYLLLQHYELQGPYSTSYSIYHLSSELSQGQLTQLSDSFFKGQFL